MRFTIFVSMNVYYDLEQIPPFKNAVVTIGTFDGVHEGHKKILYQLKTEAEAVQGETVVITFHPHPRNIIGDTTGVKLLTTLEEKITLLENEGINNLVVVPFTNEFANLTAEDYVTQFLYKKFKPSVLIIGYDHRFGKNRKGNYQLLEQYGKVLSFVVKEINEQVLQEVAISSTRARKALLQTDLVTAQNLLGYDYFFEGKVIQGDQLGRTIGYPTANIQLNNEDKLVPGDGVYAVIVERSQKSEVGSQKKEERNQKTEVGSENFENNSNLTHNFLQGMMYIGSRPVVNGKRRVIEINIFNFNEDIYNQTLKVIVKEYIRGDIHFDGLEGLKEQLALDQLAVETALNK
jgi:riboflavin kinase/FMN adenylyltransferase